MVFQSRVGIRDDSLWSSIVNGSLEGNFDTGFCPMEKGDTKPMVSGDDFSQQFIDKIDN